MPDEEIDFEDVDAVLGVLAGRMPDRTQLAVLLVAATAVAKALNLSPEALYSAMERNWVGVPPAYDHNRRN